jgi:hypothetical protein
VPFIVAKLPSFATKSALYRDNAGPRLSAAARQHGHAPENRPVLPPENYRLRSPLLPAAGNRFLPDLVREGDWLPSRGVSRGILKEQARDTQQANWDILKERRGILKAVRSKRHKAISMS